MTQKAILVDVPEPRQTAEEKAEAETAEKLARAPMFGTMEDQEAIESIAVERLLPIREGVLPGRLEPEATEDEIAQRWGGGKFRIWARDQRGKSITSRTIEIGGEPIFSSEIARAQYRRMMGLPPQAEASAHAGSGAAPPSWQEMLAIQGQADERRREDYERRMTDLERQHSREIERMRAEAEIRARERAEEEERRRRERGEEDERRQKEAAEREERRRKDAEETRQRDREFQAVMMQIAQASGAGKADPIQVLLQGFQLGQQVAGGEPTDPVTALAANLPQILDRAGSLIPGARPPAAVEQVPPTQGPPRPDQITFGGPIGSKAKRVVEHLRNQGVDPEQAMASAFDMLLATKRQTAPAEPAQPATPASGQRGRFARKAEPPPGAPPAAPVTGR